MACPDRVGRPFIIISSRVETVRIPNPPTWTSKRITSCPKRVNCRPMSRTDRPVTQLAEVDMKSASTNPMGEPAADVGSMSRAVPTAMSRANPIIDMRAGDRSRYDDIWVISDSLSIFSLIMSSALPALITFSQESDRLQSVSSGRYIATIFGEHRIELHTGDLLKGHYKYPVQVL